MATAKSIVYVDIKGVTKIPQLTQVLINQPLYNLMTTKYSKGAFSIQDYIAVDEFRYLEADSHEYVVYFEKDISIADTFLEFAIFFDKGAEVNIAVGEDWWIGQEKISITSLDLYTGSTDYNRLRVKATRGIGGTIKSDYFFSGVTSQSVLANLAYNPLMLQYKIANFKRDFRGLIVELRNKNQELVAVGVIKFLNFTAGALVIDCDDLIETLTSKTYDPLKAYLFRYIGGSASNIYTFKSIIEVTLGKLTKWTNSPGSGSEEFSYFQMNYSHIFWYLDFESLYKMLSELPSSLADQLVMIPHDLEESDDGELVSREQSQYNIGDVKVIEVRSLLDMAMFFTGYSLVFQDGIYKFRKVTGLLNAFDKAEVSAKHLMKDLKSPKYVSEQFTVIQQVELVWSDSSTFISLSDYAGVGGSKSLSFKMNTSYYESLETALREAIIDNYLLLQSLVVAELRVTIPERLIERDYKVGQIFRILDISKFYTYQYPGREIFNYGIVSNIEGEELRILVTVNSKYHPVQPMFFLTLENSFTFYDQGYISASFRITNLNELRDDIIDITDPSPFISTSGKTKWLDVGYKVKLHDREGVIDMIIGDLVRVNIDLNIGVTPIGEIVNMFYDISTGNSNDFQDGFFNIGRDRWL